MKSGAGTLAHTGGLVAAYDAGWRAGRRDAQLGRERSALELGLARQGWDTRTGEVQAYIDGYANGRTGRGSIGR